MSLPLSAMKVNNYARGCKNSSAEFAGLYPYICPIFGTAIKEQKVFVMNLKQIHHETFSF